MSTTLIVIIVGMGVLLFVLIRYIFNISFFAAKALVPDAHPFLTNKQVSSMEKFKALFVLLLLPALGFVIPELSDMGKVLDLAANLAGAAGLVTIVVEFMKSATNYDSEKHWRFLPQLYGLVIGVVLSVVFWFAGFGVFVISETISQAAIIGLLLGGLSNAWFDVAFVQHWVKVLTGREVTK